MLERPRGSRAVRGRLDRRSACRLESLATVGGERLLTDLRHIAQVLHEAALEGQLGLTALLRLAAPAARGVRREGGQERSRRLETDAAAVQVITVHTSKGLEFPVVLVPFAWDRWDPASRRSPRSSTTRTVGGFATSVARKARTGQRHVRRQSRRKPMTSCA